MSFEFDKPKSGGTNLHVELDCRTCNGDRMVLYSKRTATYNGVTSQFDEYAPCPDCNADCNTLRKGFRSPDAAQVRERLGR